MVHITCCVKGCNKKNNNKPLTERSAEGVSRDGRLAAWRRMFDQVAHVQGGAASFHRTFDQCVAKECLRDYKGKEEKDEV